MTSLDLSNLGFPLNIKAMQEIVANWPNITDLNLARNTMTQEIADLLQEFKDLRHLNLESTDMDDKMLAAVARCTTLQSLSCSHCPGITSLKPLAFCSLLQSLACNWCTITSLEPLESCPLLRALGCWYCSGITSLEPLKSCPLLQSLECSRTGVTSLEPLKFCPLLQILECSRTGITSLEPLKSCPLLRALGCCGCNGISSEKRAALQHVLPALIISRP